MCVPLSEKGPNFVIRKLEEDIDNLRRETNEKIEGLEKHFGLAIMAVFKLFRAMANFLSSTTPNTKETAIANFQFMRDCYLGLAKLAIEEEMKRDLITDFKEVLTNVLRGSDRIPFDDMIDLLLRGLGMDLTREWVSPNVIAEVWGAKALEKFKEMLSE